VNTLEEARIQARVLVPLVKALQAELGEEKGNAVVRKALGDMYRKLGEKWWRAQGERSAGDLLPVLFRRPLDAHQTFFAMGEAIAHLHYLYYAGEAKRAASADGIMRYAAR
jgi:hypothetical protein